MEAAKIVCRLCRYSERYGPGRKKMPSGRLWCLAYKTEVPANKTCPKAAKRSDKLPAGVQRAKSRQWKDPKYDF